MFGERNPQIALNFGGEINGAHLAVPLLSKLPRAELAPYITTLLAAWHAERLENERFGAWANRVGLNVLRVHVGKEPILEMYG